MAQTSSDGIDDAHDLLGRSAMALFDALRDVDERAGAGDTFPLDALGEAIYRCVTAFRIKYPDADVDEVCRSTEMGLTKAIDDWQA
jgi:hypothetical protein